MIKKRILLTTLSNISDHQDKVVVLYEEMKKRGADVYLMLPEDNDVDCETCEKTWFVKCPNRPGITKGTFNIFRLLSMIIKVKKGRFDYIIFETLHIWNLPLLFFAGKKTRVFQMIHDVIPHEGDKSAKQVHLMNKTVCKTADKILICNQMYKKELCKRYNISPKSVVTMSLWERYPELNITRNNGKMLFFGRLNPYKGADNLLRIVKLCPKNSFSIIGKPDPQISGIIEELKSYPNVCVDERYIGDKEIADVFYNCGWVVLPYNSATQSGVIVEAYKHSKPIISFDVGAISEQVEDGKTGYLVKAGDIYSFSDRVKAAATIPTESYEQFCKDAYYFGYNKFSPQKAAKKLIELCK